MDFHQQAQFCAGLLCVALVSFDVFKSIIVPRVTSRWFRIAPFLLGRVLWPVHKAIARMLPSGPRKAYYDAFAPLAFILLLLTWFLFFVVGYGLMLYALRGDVRPVITTFGDATYFAATSILTLGFGDIVASSTAARFVVISAGVTGLIFMALDVSLLFTMQNWVQQRELVVSTLISRAGAPASGLVLLLRYQELHILPQLGTSFLQWESWISAIQESHRAFPMLMYFRSTNSDDSWVGCLAAMLDAASLLATSIEYPVGESQLFYWLGCRTTKVLAAYFGLPPEDSAHMTRQEYDDGLHYLKEAGFDIISSDVAWSQFSSMRSAYMRYLVPIARAFALPLNEWIPSLNLR